MRDEPADLPGPLVDRLLRTHWQIEPQQLRHAPVGFGGYHWYAHDHSGPRWFVTANYLHPGGGWLGPDPAAMAAAHLAAAATARALARQGYEFVLAAIPDRTGAPARRVLPSWIMQVAPYQAGWSADDGSWQDPAERRQIAALVGRLHTATAPAEVRRWEFAIPGRPILQRAWEELRTRWRGGPYAERTRRLLTETREAIQARFDRYDQLAGELAVAPDRWVVTHGEPHSANVIRTSEGRMCLIDWDTVALAPPERDLVAFLDGSDLVRSAYQHAAGSINPRPAALELFTHWWALAEICGNVALFRGPHRASADAAVCWQDLCRYAREPAGASW